MLTSAHPRPLAEPAAVRPLLCPPTGAPDHALVLGETGRVLACADRRELACAILRRLREGEALQLRRERVPIRGEIRDAVALTAFHPCGEAQRRIGHAWMRQGGADALAAALRRQRPELAV
ncbi:MAG: hypothetical protein ACOY5Y_07145 [Pseudomonadota bacterium]